MYVFCEKIKRNKMSNTFITTIQIFLCKHWKCFQHSWIKNVFMIIVPIAIAWFQIHVSSSNSKGVQTNFQTITEVNHFKTHFLSYSLIHRVVVFYAEKRVDILNACLSVNECVVGPVFVQCRWMFVYYKFCTQLAHTTKLTVCAIQ